MAKLDSRTRLHKIIISIDRPIAKDGLITDYKSFLNQKDYIHLYSFNVKIFNSLLKLSLSLWTSNQRISRICLAKKIFSYLRNDKNSRLANIKKFNSESIELLFDLFRITIVLPEFATAKQIEEIQQKLYACLYSIDLTDEQLTYLVNNYEKSDYFVRKLLNYHKSSSVISKWALDNYHTDIVKGRRSNFAAVLINHNPDFEIEIGSIADDVRHFNKLDLQRFFQAKANVGIDVELSYRYYGVPIIPKQPTNEALFDHLDELINYATTIKNHTLYLLNNADIAKKYAMLWSVIFSKLPPKNKGEMLTKYYAVELHDVFVRICKRQGLSAPLKWLMNLSDKKYKEITKRSPLVVCDKQKKIIMDELDELIDINNIIDDFNLFDSSNTSSDDLISVDESSSGAPF